MRNRAIENLELQSRGRSAPFKVALGPVDVLSHRSKYCWSSVRRARPRRSPSRTYVDLPHVHALLRTSRRAHSTADALSCYSVGAIATPTFLRAPHPYHSVAVYASMAWPVIHQITPHLAISEYVTHRLESTTTTDNFQHLRCSTPRNARQAQGHPHPQYTLLRDHHNVSCHLVRRIWLADNGTDQST